MKPERQEEKNGAISYLGIDFGKKKIGIAIAPEGILAIGLSIVPNDENFFTKLEKIITENDVKIIVVGLPLSMSGQSSSCTKRALKFVSQIKELFSTKKVFTYDERLTSREAKNNLPFGSPDDAEAARIILQGFLDREKNSKNK